jgi:hypothetical protein
METATGLYAILNQLLSFSRKVANNWILTMDPSMMQAVGRVAGIGGLALGVILLLFREIIRKNIFPKLNGEHAFRLLRQFMYLTFSISAMGILAWVWTEPKQRTATDGRQNVSSSGAIIPPSKATNDQVLLVVRLKPASHEGASVYVDGRLVASINNEKNEVSIILPLEYSNKEVLVEVRQQDHAPFVKRVRLMKQNPTILTVASQSPPSVPGPSYESRNIVDQNGRNNIAQIGIRKRAVCPNRPWL